MSIWLSSGVLMKGITKAAAAPPVPTDVDFAVDLHRLVASNAPRPTPVESIPEQYMQMYWKPFPIPPEAVPLGTLPDILARDFGHLFAFNRTTRTGEVFVTTALPPDNPLDNVASFHIETRRSEWALSQPTQQPAKAAAPPAKKAKASPKQGPKASPVTNAAGVKLTAGQEQSAQLLMRVLHQLLLSNPSVGEGSSFLELRGKLQDGFYDLVQLPLVLSTGESVDPIELISKGQGKCFSRVLQDPLSESVSVKAFAENPQFPPVSTLTFNWSQGAAQVRQQPLPMQASVEAMKLATGLRQKLVDNLKMLEQAIAKPPTNPTSVGLWKQAFEALTVQETQNGQILQSLLAI